MVTYEQFLTRPRSAFAARIAGINLRSGTMAGDGMLRSPVGVDIAGPDGDRPTGRQCRRGSLRAASSVGLPGSASREPTKRVCGHDRGDRKSRRCRPSPSRDEAGQPGLSADITASAAAELDLVPGSAATFVVKATETLIYAQGAGS